MTKCHIWFLSILMISYLINNVSSSDATLNETPADETQESPRELAPTFEEEWAALIDVDEGITDSVGSFSEDLLQSNSSSSSSMIDEALPPKIEWNDEDIQNRQPSQTERRNHMASQLMADMEALGINQAEVDLLSTSAKVSQHQEQSKTTSSRFLTTTLCGGKYLCRQGDRGPCRPNEIFKPLVNVSSSSVISSSCSGLVSSPWNGCFPAKRVGSANALSTVSQGVCTLRFRSRPCFGYPPGYRYSKSTRRCYPCSLTNQWDREISGPCSPDMTFVDIDGISGSCRCRDRNSLISGGHCYRMYSKEPCPDGQWLEPWVNGYGMCKRSPCPSSRCDGQHIYWKATPTSPGGCYKSFARGPCKHGSYFLIEDYATKRGRCVSRYGSSFDPQMYGWPSAVGARVSPRYRFFNGARNRQAQSSIWSNFGMYPAFEMQDADFDYDFSLEN